MYAYPPCTRRSLETPSVCPHSSVAVTKCCVQLSFHRVSWYLDVTAEWQVRGGDGGRWVGDRHDRPTAFRAQRAHLPPRLTSTVEATGAALLATLVASDKSKAIAINSLSYYVVQFEN